MSSPPSPGVSIASSCPLTPSHVDSISIMPSVSVARCVPFLVMSHHCLLLTVISFQSFLIPVVSLPCSTLSVAPHCLPISTSSQSPRSPGPTYLVLLFLQFPCRHPSVPLTIAPNTLCIVRLSCRLKCTPPPLPVKAPSSLKALMKHFLSRLHISQLTARLHALNRQ